MHQGSPCAIEFTCIFVYKGFLLNRPQHIKVSKHTHYLDVLSELKSNLCYIQDSLTIDYERNFGRPDDVSFSQSKLFIKFKLSYKQIVYSDKSLRIRYAFTAHSDIAVAKLLIDYCWPDVLITAQSLLVISDLAIMALA